MIDGDWYWHAREQSRKLAVEMVRLEQLARRLVSEKRFDKAGEVLADREGVQHERSLLLREMWDQRRVSVP